MAYDFYCHDGWVRQYRGCNEIDAIVPRRQDQPGFVDGKAGERVERWESISNAFLSEGISPRTILRNVFVDFDMRRQLANMHVRLTKRRQRRMRLKHHTVEVLLPRIQVERGELFLDAHAGIPVDDLSLVVDLEIGGVAGLAAVEQIQYIRIEAHRKTDGQVECGLQREHD